MPIGRGFPPVLGPLLFVLFVVADLPQPAESGASRVQRVSRDAAKGAAGEVGVDLDEVFCEGLFRGGDALLLQPLLPLAHPPLRRRRRLLVLQRLDDTAHLRVGRLPACTALAARGGAQPRVPPAHKASRPRPWLGRRGLTPVHAPVDPHVVRIAADRVRQELAAVELPGHRPGMLRRVRRHHPASNVHFSRRRLERHRVVKARPQPAAPELL